MTSKEFQEIIEYVKSKEPLDPKDRVKLFAIECARYNKKKCKFTINDCKIVCEIDYSI